MQLYNFLYKVKTESLPPLAVNINNTILHQYLSIIFNLWSNKIFKVNRMNRVVAPVVERFIRGCLQILLAAKWGGNHQASIRSIKKITKSFKNMTLSILKDTNNFIFIQKLTKLFFKMVSKKHVWCIQSVLSLKNNG